MLKTNKQKLQKLLQANMQANKRQTKESPTFASMLKIDYFKPN